jgi:Na+/H+ antiporter NhaC
LNALADPDHAAIVIFSMMLGGMVGIITRSGGTHGIVKNLSHWADHPRRGQIAAWGMGMLIFFDDYANTLIVGNTLRPITDRLKISREKLSYIVDSTAAPVVSIAIFSTWIGFELGLLQEAFQQLGVQENVYWFYLRTIPYRFYSLLTLIFVLAIAWSGRDFGPMLRAERRARATGKILGDNARPLFDEHADLNALPPENRRHGRNAILPILFVIVVTLLGLFYNGRQALMQAGSATLGLRDIIGAANPFSALLWSSFAGSVVAAILALSQRILNIRETVDAWIAGVKSMVLAMLVIVMAWAIGAVCQDLHTAETAVRFTHGFLAPQWLPAVTFITAGLISFATGTSWGTLSILIPIVAPVAWAITQQPGVTISFQQHVFLSTIASVLAGATFGDHCSPISDTTIMSSMASGADHIDHVRTQIPYALTVAGIAMLTGYIPAGFGVPVWISLSFGVAMMAAVLIWVAKPVGK